MTNADKAFIRRVVKEEIHKAVVQLGKELSETLSSEQTVQHIGGTTAATNTDEILYEEGKRLIHVTRLAKRFREPPVVGF